MDMQTKPQLVFLDKIAEDECFETFNVELNGIKGTGKINKRNGRRMLSAAFIGDLTAKLAPHLMDNFLDALNAERINDAN